MTYVIASFSGGKDSTAMVLGMIEKGERLDKVLFCDTGLEFPAMYSHIEKVKKYVESHGIEFVTLKSNLTFEYMLYQKPVYSKKHGEHLGLGFPFIRTRWCTKHLKVIPMKEYAKSLDDNVLFCVGLAYDEKKRIDKPQNQKDRHPLYEWGWTEKDCLDYCYSKGFDWYDPSINMGLYEIFDRTSCWLCSLSSIKNLKNLRKYYPDLWHKIGELWEKLKEQREKELDIVPVGAIYFSHDCTWQQLEDRFAKEDLKEKE